MSVSYPYFTIAKEFNIEYSKVLTFIDIVENRNLIDKVICTEVWQKYALGAYHYEQQRRKTVI